MELQKRNSRRLQVSRETLVPLHTVLPLSVDCGRSVEQLSQLPEKRRVKADSPQQCRAARWVDHVRYVPRLPRMCRLRLTPAADPKNLPESDNTVCRTASTFL